MSESTAIHDLLYGGMAYQSELEALFPTAKIKRADNEIHQDRVTITVEMDEWDYRKIIVTNGFGKMSLSVQLGIMDPSAVVRKEWRERLDAWMPKGETDDQATR